MPICKKNLGAQAALEYLMTYGWTLIIIAVVVGVIIYVTSGSLGGVTCQSKNPQIILKEWSFAAGDDTVGFTLQNATGNTILLQTDCVSSSDGTNILERTGTVATTCLPTTIAKGETFTVQNLDSQASGSFSNASATISYSTASGLPVNAIVSCSGNSATASTTGTFTLIESCPYTINDSGTYRLSSNLSTLGTGVLIYADNVTLDCAGHSIQGPGNNYGVILSNVSGVTVQNCTLTNFSGGIDIVSGSGNTISNNTVQSNSSMGIWLHDSPNNTLTGNTANSNSVYGIYAVGNNNTLIGNQANSNGIYGIRIIGTGNTLQNNTACLNNGSNDFYCSASCCSDLGGNTANNVHPDCGVAASSC